ncbi:unnamed protein product, partial [Mesorhabditis spiculigera]
MDYRQPLPRPRIEGIYTQGIIRSLIDGTSVRDMDAYDKIILTLQPNNSSMGRKLRIYAKHYPQAWDPSWRSVNKASDADYFECDTTSEERRVVEYYNQHLDEYEDIATLAAQRRLADATKSFGSSFLLHGDFKAHPRTIRILLSRAFLALARACNEGQLRCEHLIELSFSHYADNIKTARVKINTNRPATPEMLDEIVKVLKEHKLQLHVKVKTSVATYIAHSLRDRQLPHIRFESPAQGFTRNVEDLEGLLKRTSFFR